MEDAVTVAGLMLFMIAALYLVFKVLPLLVAALA